MSINWQVKPGYADYRGPKDLRKGEQIELKVQGTLQTFTIDKVIKRPVPTLIVK